MYNRYHDVGRRVLLEEKERLEYHLTVIKPLIANTSRQDPYGNNASDLMKRQRRLMGDLKNVELSLKVLRRDAQRRIQEDWELKQAEIRRKAEGSYNCLGGC